MNELETIRRAYRYVVAYERRVLDAITRIDDAVTDAGFERNLPHRWWPLYRAFPSRDWAAARWAWDHVPCYAFRYQWNAGNENAAGTRWVLVDHIADTAFEEKRLSDDVEPEPLDGLPPVEGSKTVLRWLVIELAAPLPAALYKLQWTQLLPKHLGVPALELLPRVATPMPIRREVSPLTLTTFCVDLASIDGADALAASFTQPLLEVLRRPAP